MDKDLVGSTFGQFQIVDLIGHGGMASVYKAYQRSLDRYVAIKVLPPSLTHETDFVERFRREALSVARLEHPNILPVYDCGEQNGVPFIAMALTTHGTVQDRIGSPLPLDWCVKIGCQVARALDHAHGHDVVHRDVKPSNLLLHEHDWVLLADFGIAKILHERTPLTQTGLGVGTVGYMSPEQAQGLPVDGRSDVYSLAVVLVEMLTGLNPFSAETPLAMVLKQISGPAPSVRAFRPESPGAIDDVIRRALSLSLDERFQSAAAFAEALEAAAEGRSEDRDRQLAELRETLSRTVWEQNWDEAISLANQILKLEPGDHEVSDLLPRIAEQNRLNRERQSVISALVAKARAAADQHQFEEALAVLEGLLKVDHDNPEARSLRSEIQRAARVAAEIAEAEHLMDARRYLQAREKIRAVLAEDPFNRRALGLLGATERLPHGLSESPVSEGPGPAHPGA